MEATTVVALEEHFTVPALVRRIDPLAERLWIFSTTSEGSRSPAALKDTSSKGSIVFFSLWEIRHPKMATRSMNTEISAAAATADREDRYLSETPSCRRWRRTRR